jgi:SAM-dependent methyltransferase
MPELEELLRCPWCQMGGLDKQGEEFVCSSCARRYPIVGGIPRLVDSLPADAEQVQRVFDFEHRRFKDSWYTRFEPRLVEQFLEDCQLPREYFHGKRVLDAGCGSGRWTYALAELGADVVAIDFTAGGLESAREALGDRPNVAFCQADLLNLPLRPESFDFVVSWGVLHHTSNTRDAFSNLPPLLKAGGMLYVMVYERASPLQLFFTNWLRALMRRLPDERRYAACRFLVIENPIVYRVLAPFLMVSRYDPANAELDRRTLQFGLFDAYSPRHNHVHTPDEVVGWFRECGFEQVTALETSAEAVKVRGIRSASRAVAAA